MNFLRTSNNSFFYGCHCLSNFYIAKVLHDCRIFAFKESQNLSFWTLFLGIFSYAQFLDVQDFNSITSYEIHFKIRPASLADGADRIRSSASIPIPANIFPYNILSSMARIISQISGSEDPAPDEIKIPLQNKVQHLDKSHPHIP